MQTQTIEQLTQRISKGSEDDPHLYYRLGKAYLKVEKEEAAIRVLKRAVALSPEKVGYHLLLAKTYVKQHEFVPAKKQYQKVLRLEPSNLKAHMNLGVMFEFYLRDPQRARTHYRKYRDFGGDDARVLKRLKLLDDELKAPSAEDQAATRGRDQIAERERRDKKEDILRELYWWRDKWERRIKGKENILTRILFPLSLFVVISQCLNAFPLTPVPVTTFLGVLIAILTALRPRAGLIAGFVFMFFPIAFYSPLLGYLYAGGAWLLLRIYKSEHPANIIIIMLIPLLLKANLAYVIPLGAALLLDARPARRLAILGCLAGFGYMLAGDIHQLGPLSINHLGAPILFSAAESESIVSILKLRWFWPMISVEIIDPVQNFVLSIFPSLLLPPSFIVQVLAWGAASHLAARFCRRRRPRDMAAALGIVAGVFFLQALIMEILPGRSFFSSWAAAKCLLISAAAILPIAFMRMNFYRPDAGMDVEGISWDSIGGLEDVKKEIQMATQYQFKSTFSRYIKRFGLRGIQGILFYGPPGCGKTMFAKVLAKEMGAAFFSVKGSDFRSKWYGETEQNLSMIFEQCRENAPSILFFDEADALFGKSSDTTIGDSPEKGIQALFLTEMDGVKSSGGVLVVGATNSPDSIDPAILRPGRFDKLIYIPLPDKKGRESIFRIQLRKKPLAGALDFQKLAKMTQRFSGADIADVCSKVAEQAMKDSLESGHTTRITMDALEAQIKATKPSVSLESLRRYEEMQEKYHRRVLKSETEPPEDKETYTWEQVGGLDRIKQELIEAIETPLKRPELYEKYKIAPPKGVLFYGPPGCGKTLMAKIVANQCGAHFLSVDTKKESGESIRKWFVRARENTPSVLFFDEIDSIASSRGAGFVPDQGVVTQLLVDMDGMEGLKQVVVIAATNRPDQLDTALMRPGRFDRLIYIPPPDVDARGRILKIHFKGKPLAKDVDLREIAEKTENYSGADLAALTYEASMSLIRKAEAGHQSVTMEDITSAMDKIKSSISPEDLAYFEEMKVRYSRG